jgi:hypothetical protein
LLYKCEFPYTEAQLVARLQEFKEVEADLPERVGRLSPEAEIILCNAIEFARLILRDFSITEPPRHGPGAVAAHEKAGEKYDFKFSEYIEESFPYDDWFATYRVYDPEDGRLGSECTVAFTGGMLAMLGEENRTNEIGPARGLFVNKDSRGPRYISAEPKELMWLQQALGRSLMRYLEYCSFTRGHLNFSDQRVNGNLALDASSRGNFATIDLKDASDRVSLAVVRAILPSNLCRLLEACRSKSAVLPDGSEILLRKFAPMGSACCFPVESLIFFLLSTACIAFLRGWELERCARLVYVYGDDIIVPTWAAQTLFRIFPEFSLAVNEAKCYVHGPFRESCGVDAIDGVNVTPVKIRKPLPVSSNDVSGLISWAEASNLFFYAGFWRTASHIAELVELHRPLPYVPYQSGIFGKTGYHDALEVRGRQIKWDKNIHRPYAKFLRVRSLQEDWSENTAPASVVLHALANAKEDACWSVHGRSEASTLCTTSEGFLSLRHSRVHL